MFDTFFFVVLSVACFYGCLLLFLFVIYVLVVFVVCVLCVSGFDYYVLVSPRALLLF